MKRLFALIALASVSTLQAYNPPIGIPNPSVSFGWEIDRPTRAFPPEWTAGTPGPAAGCFYVDKTDVNSTDTANPNGYPTKPRKSIPEGNLAAGTFIYVHAGTYTSAESAGDRYDWNGVGTSGNPIWISGNPTTRPVIQDLCHIGTGGNTSYIIFENFEISGIPSATLSMRPTTDGNNIDHILVRNVRRVGTSQAADQDGISVGNSASADSIPNSRITDVVIYNCDVSFCGDPTPTGSDDCGIYNAYHTKRVWVLDNVIHNVGADSVAGSHYSNYTDKLTEDYYIGRNTCYGNGENGVDLKNVQGFIISENVIYGPFVREQGYAMVFHYGASTSFHPREGRILFNTIYHCSGGIYTGLSSGMDNVDIIGNRIYDIKAVYAAQADTLNGACIQMGGTTTGANSVFRIVNNTFHDYEMGLKLRPQPGDAMKVHGNLFSSRSLPSGYELEVDMNGRELYVASNYNMFCSTPAPAFFWTGSSRTLSFMKTTALREVNSVTGSALFVDTSTANFHLGSGSNAIDVAPEGPVGDSAYDAFSAFTLIHSFLAPNAVSLDVRLDLDRRIRPVDGLWDAGAFESALPPNAAPGSLQVSP